MAKKSKEDEIREMIEKMMEEKKEESSEPPEIEPKPTDTTEQEEIRMSILHDVSIYRQEVLKVLIRIATALEKSK